ncbi:WD repeat protein [Blumeria hordei DH14]|uniref:WD repeat protein n=1 Tax=Blumeria graminis f. sp. hordei (strain DH14) TaxID=546991 RepID=N1JNM6_BLUG1|nr:WD repeat protein [Blumeria hordei DH14]
MAMKRARQRISYVLPLTDCHIGHRLGVNGLAFDSNQSILYSGGRDGAICAWNYNNNPNKNKEIDVSSNFRDESLYSPASLIVQSEAHTHWVNDIVLTQGNTTLVSASSDLTVKAWRPTSHGLEAPQTIGQHADYVKCLATPGSQVDWVASGGLDRKACLWDLNGGGKILEIEVRDDKFKNGSIYALASTRGILATGGPESILRLWDPRSGKRITKFIGHTDNIRDILINESGDTVITASSDQTIKVWSVTTCRFMHTLSIHNDSVWSLFSDDPNLKTFYSSDRSGLVVKTNLHRTLKNIEDRVSIALAQENVGVNKVIKSGDSIWTATSSSSINRWANVDSTSGTRLPEDYKIRNPSNHLFHQNIDGCLQQEISPNSVFRVPNSTRFSLPVHDAQSSTTLLSVNDARKGSIIVDIGNDLIEPIHSLPEETIEGQHGLVKHKMLNDRRRVLTLDTAGDILMWDLVQCVPIKSFGKRYLEDVEAEVNTVEAVAPWCSVDTRTGRLAVSLEEYNCFDAEVYADELDVIGTVEFREDQRINLGKWVLRSLFIKFVDEIIRSDETDRQNLVSSLTGDNSCLPLVAQSSFVQIVEQTEPVNNISTIILTPANNNPKTSYEASIDKGASFTSKDSVEDPACSHNPVEITKKKKNKVDPRGTEKSQQVPTGTEKDNPKESHTFFTKNAETSVFADEKTGDESEISEDVDKEKEVDDTFEGVLQSITAEYRKSLLENPGQPVTSLMKPSPETETPLLELPPMTTVIIQEETSGGSADLYRGTVSTVGNDVCLIKKWAPRWLGDLLLRNRIVAKEPVKVSFVLLPWKDTAHNVVIDGTSRLNANRMLRVKKIISYVAERIESLSGNMSSEKMKPEDYLELYCYDKASTFQFHYIWSNYCRNYR